MSVRGQTAKNDGQHARSALRRTPEMLIGSLMASSLLAQRQRGSGVRIG